MHLTPALAALASYWPVLALIIPLVLGLFGSALTGVGNVLASTPWTWVRGMGHTCLLIGGLLTGIYSHWPSIAKTVGEFVSKLSSIVPKGPGGGAAAIGVFSLFMLIGCSSAPKLPPKEGAALAIKGGMVTCRVYLAQDKERDPVLDELCTRLLAPSECDPADAGTTEGAARGAIAPEDGGAQ